jgi:hypothetical protein
MNFQLSVDEISAFFSNPQFPGGKYFFMVCACADVLPRAIGQAHPLVPEIFK